MAFKKISEMTLKEKSEMSVKSDLAFLLLRDALIFIAGIAIMILAFLLIDNGWVKYPVMFLGALIIGYLWKQYGLGPVLDLDKDDPCPFKSWDADMGDAMQDYKGLNGNDHWRRTHSGDWND